MQCETDGISLHCSSPYIYWSPSKFEGRAVTLDGEFTVEELKAIVEWVEEHRDRS